jgi:hypothetical protein
MPVRIEAPRPQADRWSTGPYSTAWVVLTTRQWAPVAPLAQNVDPSLTGPGYTSAQRTSAAGKSRVGTWRAAYPRQLTHAGASVGQVFQDLSRNE